MHIATYDTDTNKIIDCWKNVTNIEKKGEEIHFLHESSPTFFLARRGNYIIVADNVVIDEGMEVTPELQSQDQKSQFIKTEIEKLREDLTSNQEAINYLLGI